MRMLVGIIRQVSARYEWSEKLHLFINAANKFSWAESYFGVNSPGASSVEGAPPQPSLTHPNLLILY